MVQSRETNYGVNYSPNLQGLKVLRIAFLVIGEGQDATPTVLLRDSADADDLALVDTFLRRVKTESTYSVVRIRPEATIEVKGQGLDTVAGSTPLRRSSDDEPEPAIGNVGQGAP